MSLNTYPASPWSSCIKCLKFNAGAYSAMSSRERSEWKAILLGCIPAQALVFMFPSSSHGCWNSLPSEHSPVRTLFWCRGWKMSLLKNYSKQASFWPSPFVLADFCQHGRGLGVRVIVVVLESLCLLILGENSEDEKAQLFGEFLSLCSLGGWSYKEEMGGRLGSR